MFSYDIHYIEKANTILDSVHSNNIVENFEDFKSDCLDRSTIVKKLAELSASGTIDSFINKIKVEPTLIQNTIDKYNLGTSIKNNQLVYTDVSSLSEIINLISENYFESDITQHQYVAKGKNRHNSTKSNSKRSRRGKGKKKSDK